MPDDWLTREEALEEIMRSRGCPRVIADALLQEWSSTYDLCNYFVTDPPSPRFNAAGLRWCLETQQPASVKKPNAKGRRYKLDPTLQALREMYPNGLPSLPTKTIKAAVERHLKDRVSEDTVGRAIKIVRPSS